MPFLSRRVILPISHRHVNLLGTMQSVSSGCAESAVNENPPGSPIAAFACGCLVQDFLADRGNCQAGNVRIFTFYTRYSAVPYGLTPG